MIPIIQSGGAALSVYDVVAGSGGFNRVYFTGGKIV